MIGEVSLLACGLVFWACYKVENPLLTRTDMAIYDSSSDHLLELSSKADLLLDVKLWMMIMMIVVLKI